MWNGVRPKKRIPNVRLLIADCTIIYNHQIELSLFPTEMKFYMNDAVNRQIVIYQCIIHCGYNVIRKLHFMRLYLYTAVYTSKLVYYKLILNYVNNKILNAIKSFTVIMTKKISL